MKRCVIIAGSPNTNIEHIKKNVSSNDFIICADKGYLFAQKANIIPNIIVGDFDSYKGRLPKNKNIEIIKLEEKKDMTDTFVCAEIGIKKGYSDFLILGATGGRLDHYLGNIAVLHYIINQNKRAVISSKEVTIKLLKEGEHTIKNVLNKVFSVFPYGESSVNVTYKKDVEYPLNKYSIKRDSTIGVSNVFTSDTCILTINKGQGLILINN